MSEESTQRGEAVICTRRTRTEKLDMQPQTTGLWCYLWRDQNEREIGDQQLNVPCIIP